MDLNETRDRIIYEKDGPIARITLNWPEKANAQDQKLAEEVDAALLDADRDYDIKVLVLKANGKGFCSGHAIGNNAVDYPAFVEGAKRMGTPWKPQTDLFVKPTMNLWEFSKPTIALVHGYCVGGGTHYGLITDIVIASEDAYFSYPPLQGFGMPSGECSIEPWVFMNWRRAAYYLYLAEVIDAFVADAPALLAALRRSLEEKDADELRRAAHTLKSNGATFGAEQFSELCRQLEQRAKSGQLTGASERALSRIRLRRVGFVFQSFQLIDELTGAENVLLAARLPGVAWVAIRSTFVRTRSAASSGSRS